MRKVQVRSLGLLSLVVLVAVLACAPVWGIEGGLLGIQIGATPKDLMEAYGPPTGIVLTGPGGLTLNTMGPGLGEALAAAGLGSAGRTGQPGTPDWARPVWPASLASDQQMWIYRLQGGVSAGFIIKGKGLDASVTDIIAASFKANPRVETEKGIRLGDKFAQVLLNYGYPPLIQPYAAEVQPVAAPARVGAEALAGAGMPTFSLPGGPGGPLGPMGPAAGPGMVGQMRGRMMGGAFMPGVSPGIARGTGPVATLGGTRVVRTTPGAQVIVVNHQPVTFTRHCVILYDGLAFTLYDFKVVRIHVTQ